MKNKLYITLLVENELYATIKLIYESEDMSTEEKQEARKQVIEEFCKENEIHSEEDLQYITGILERMKESEEKNKENDKILDFYEGNGNSREETR